MDIFNFARRVLFFWTFDVHLRKLANWGQIDTKVKHEESVHNLFFIFPCWIVQEQTSIIVDNLDYNF